MKNGDNARRLDVVSYKRTKKEKKKKKKKEEKLVGLEIWV
jgi:hypothetical protein